MSFSLNEKKIKLAVILLGVRVTQGGGYQQALNDCTVLCQVTQRGLLDATFYTEDKQTFDFLKNTLKAKVVFFRLSFLGRFFIKLRGCFISLKVLKLLDYFRVTNPLEKVLIKHKTDLVHFVTPSSYAISLELIPYTITVWDNCHRDWPEFPEVFSGREFERRERLYWKMLPKAVSIFVDSNLSKENLIRRYNLDSSRIYVMPFLPSCRNQRLGTQKNTDAKRNKDIYIFYPAQLWAHKNHIYILMALRILKAQGIELKAIFAGGDRDGNLAKLKRISKELGVEKQVEWKGFVSDSEVQELMLNAFALVMPTYFGPTNLPPLEAFEAGVPVLYSDIPGAKEFLGDAALYMNLKDPRCLAGYLERLFCDDNMRYRLIQEGDKRLKEIQSFDRLGEWSRVIDSFRLLKGLK